MHGDEAAAHTPRRGDEIGAVPEVGRPNSQLGAQRPAFPAVVAGGEQVAAMPAGSRGGEVGTAVFGHLPDHVIVFTIESGQRGEQVQHVLANPAPLVMG